MKRICFSLITALLLVCSFSSVSAKSGTGELFCTDAYVNDDNSFTVEISFTADSAIRYIEFELIFPTEIRLMSYAVGDGVMGAGELIKRNDGYRYIFSSADGKSFGSEEALLRLILSADKDVPNGDYGITADNIRIVDADDNMYFPDAVTGTVTVYREAEASSPPFQSCTHSFNGWTVVKSPTYETEGERVKICARCGSICKALKIPAIPRRDISSAEISYEKSLVFTGKALKPKVTVRYKGIALEEGKDYTVSYSDNKAVGNGKITVKGKGEYTGELTVSFTIKPKTVKIKKVKAYSNGKVKISWSKVKNCDGYRIYVRYPGSNKYVLLKMIKNSSRTSYTTKKLGIDGKFRIKIRSYVLSENKRIYSSYSKAKVFRL